ncbi:unnamed protein product [Moneuplotes crassus]|uniref:Uncharacterized protein n=1 Tax=Euplotes crassus TaxID=5936 RepID=A0AAD1Y711_EUPCR|nr:unnamed protein product [Moneuplotes crassus]
MVQSGPYTKDSFFTEWYLATEELQQVPENILTRSTIESILVANELPMEFINTHFNPLIEYCEGKKITEVDENVVEQYAQEIFSRACAQGIAISE